MQSFRSDKNLLKNLSPSPRGGDKMRLTLNNDKIEYRSAYDLLVNRQTSFKGWSCNAGVSGVIIDEIGDVFRGWCKAGGVIGHISNFTIPTSPVICPASQCNCLVDVFSEKEKCFPGDQE